jgi:hypothetical protein
VRRDVIKGAGKGGGAVVGAGAAGSVTECFVGWESIEDAGRGDMEVVVAVAGTGAAG